jgi:hypothetical protein
LEKETGDDIINDHEWRRYYRENGEDGRGKHDDFHLLEGEEEQTPER